MNEPAIDMKEVMERVQDDRELLMELLQIFSEDFVEKKKSLSDAVAQQNFDELKNITHSLKGASGNISAKKLHAAFLDLEQTAKTKNIKGAQDILPILDREFADLQKFIAELKK